MYPVKSIIGKIDKYSELFIFKLWNVKWIIIEHISIFCCCIFLHIMEFSHRIFQTMSPYLYTHPHISDFHLTNSWRGGGHIHEWFTDIDKFMKRGPLSPFNMIYRYRWNYGNEVQKTVARNGNLCAQKSFFN